MRVNLLMFFCLIAFTLKSSLNAHWPMVAHDPQRTSWASEDTIGACSRFVWAKPFHPWILARSHIITVEGSGSIPDLVLVTTVDGIYALDPVDGTQKWFYAMDPPPGNSPSVAGNTVYVCGTDHTIHAVNATTGAKIWQTDMAGGPYTSDPLVVNGKVYAGNHDGYFYCFNAADGSLAWTYPAIGQARLDPIWISAAYQTYTDYPDGVIFFASMGLRAYALRADTGALVWKSTKVFPLARISAYWPVIYQDRVIFVGMDNYPQMDYSNGIVRQWLKPYIYADAAAVTAHVDAQGWLDLTNHVNALIAHPSYNTFFMLDRNTGNEAEISPFLYTGNDGDRYPPSIGPNPVGSGNLIWANTPWMLSWYTEGRFAGWQVGTNKVRTIPAATSGMDSCDETQCQSIIGNNYMYYNRGGDGNDAGGAFNLTGGGSELWIGSNGTFGSGYNVEFRDRKYGNDQGNGMEAHQNPPVPLKGKVYFHRSSAVICMGQ